MRVLVSLSVVAAFTLSVARPTNAQHPLDGTSQIIQIGGTGAKVYSQGSSDGDYPPNWTAPQFPDSTWNPPTQVSQTSSGCNGSLIGWQTPGYYGSNQNNYYLFRQTFTLNQALDYYGSILNLGATSGVLGDIYVNGTEVTSRYDAPSGSFSQIAIGQYLQAGLNVIAFSLNPSAYDSANNPCNAVTFTVNLVVYPAPTDTPTATDTPTDTPTATDIPTSTNTPTNTPTASPTATNTPTNTSTPVPPPATATLVPPPTTATSAAPPATARPVPPPATSAPAPPPATATSAPPSPVFVAVPTETRTPTRHSNRRIQGPALIIRALPKSVASGSKLAIILHTASRAQVTLTVRVTTLKTVYTGKPKHRKRVTHTLVLYSAVLKGKTDKQGLFKGELPIIYKSAKPVSAQLSVSVHTTNGTTTRNTPVTILPQQHQKYRKP